MPELYPEDQARVDQVLSAEQYQVEYKPFRFFRLLGILFLGLLGISGISYLVAWNYGFV